VAEGLTPSHKMWQELLVRGADDGCAGRSTNGIATPLLTSISLTSVHVRTNVRVSLVEHPTGVRTGRRKNPC